MPATFTLIALQSNLGHATIVFFQIFKLNGILPIGLYSGIYLIVIYLKVIYYDELSVLQEQKYHKKRHEEDAE